MNDQAERDKLHDLAARIAKAEQAHLAQRKTDDSQNPGHAKARMVRIGTDFIATILGALGLGWFVDQQFETAPWAMIGFLVAGFALACYELVAQMSAPADGQDKKDKE